MILDFRALDAQELDADICIVGGGVVGIVLARALSASGARICMLESGGFEPEERVQDLYDGVDTGFRDAYDLKNSRLRYFGGSSNHWVGHCCPHTAMDFETRPWVPYSGWPMARSDLESYYRQAQEILDVGAYCYDLRDMPERMAQLPAFDARVVCLRVWRLSPPTRLASKYRGDLERTDDVQIYLYANVIELETDRDVRRVIQARIRTLDGKTARVRARYFVLACGGIENARLLLLSNRFAPRGLGNDHDLVGRFYIDQLRVEGAALAVARDDRPLMPLMGSFQNDGVRFESMLCASDAVQERDRALDWAVELHPLTETAEWAVGLRDLRDAWRAGRWPEHLGRDIWSVLSDLGGVAQSAYHRMREHRLRLRVRCEIAPQPDNRVTLSRERDALGQNKIQRSWRLGEMERHTVRSAVRRIGAELGRLDLARVRVADWLVDDDGEWPSDTIAGPHQSGTTRMATDPRHGVVDANCRVHGLANLYVGGSSVFPAGGYTHPTLTVVALTLRLADHLAAALDGSARASSLVLGRPA